MTKLKNALKWAILTALGMAAIAAPFVLIELILLSPLATTFFMGVSLLIIGTGISYALQALAANE